MFKLFSLLLLWGYSSYSLAAPALWSATKGEQKLWLYGSIHVADSRLATLPEPLLRQLAQSDLLYFEVDPDTVTPAVLAPYLALPANETWQDRLGESLTTQLEQLIDEMGLPQLKPLPPWFAVMQLSQVNAQRLGFSSHQGVDMQLLHLAQQQHIPVRGLEPPTLVFKLLASLSERQLEQDFVRHTLAEQDDLAQQLELLLSTWQSGDEQALLALLHDEQSPELSAFIEQELLLARNQLWLKNLKHQAPQHALIVVGALHLYGEYGLLELLQQAGYEVNKINP
ncbi:MAG: TraB/GumN family protein [Oceanisphaera sp.]|uniref:TraB/GumN family protein n=1 Tax=Oceanisphaera sp. TaxID=1929979 RepID=UPI003C7253DE